MFLIERLLGVSVYAILLLIVCNGISTSKAASIGKWLAFYVIALSCMAFFYQPHQGADLVRLIGYMHNWAAMTPAVLLEYCSHSSVPVYIAYFWLIGQTGVDGLLTSVTCFIYYSFVFNGFYVFFREYEICPRHAAWGVALFMSFGVFLEVISGIRSSLAIAISFWCCVREIVLRKNPVLHVPLYLIASLMHPMGLFLTILRFATLVVQKTDSSYERFAYVGISVLGVTALVALGPEYVNAMIDKGVSYSTGVHYSSLWETVIHVVLVIISLSLIVKQREKLFKYGGEQVVNNLLIMQTAILVVVFIGFFLDYAIYHRMSTYLGMYSALAFPLVINSEEIREGGSTRYIKFVKMGILTMLFLACARGNLSNYKFFVM